MFCEGFAAILYCVFTFCLLGEAGASLRIQAFPPDINVIDVKPLTLHCSYEPPANASSPQAMPIEYLSISKRDPSSGTSDVFSELTTSNPNAPTQPLLAQTRGITSVSGSISRDKQGTSRISVTWNSPTTTDAGIYVCTAHTLNDVGIPIALTNEVTVREDSMLVIAQKLKSLQNDLIGQQDNCRLATAHLVEFEVWRKTISTALKYFANNLMFNRSSEYKNRTYARSLFKVENADVAGAVCQTVGGYLAEVNDADEWTFVKQFLTQSGIGINLIGGRDDIQEGRWYWENSKTTMTFAPWGTGQPDDYESREDCLEIIATSASSPQFNDIYCQCNTRGGFICEIPKDGQA